MICDFHVHSAASDGNLTPAELVEEGRRLDLDCFALTDHDSVDGIAPATERGRELGLEVMPGIEVSVCEDGGRRQLHILGLLIDPLHRGLTELLSRVRSARSIRAVQMIDLLHRIGVEVELHRVREIAGAAPLSRPHIARALVECGACRDEEQAFARYLGRGRPAFLPADGVDSGEAIEIIHAAGGMASLAHPPLSVGTDQPGGMERFVSRLVGLGLDGIEIQHPSHTTRQRRQFRRLARQYDLVPTGGSDFHGTSSPGIMLGSGRAGNVSVGEETYQAIHARSATYRR